MDSYQTIAGHFQGTVETIVNSVDDLAEPIANASQLLAGALLGDRKIIACGNGADSALAQLFASHLLGRYETERPALPALALGGDCTGASAITHSSGSNDIFSRPLRALGQDGDVLLCINSSTGASNLLRAMQAAHERNMAVVLMSNPLDGELGNLIEPEDVELRVTTDHPGRIVELHTMIIHCFCELIDQSLFGAYSQE